MCRHSCPVAQADGRETFTPQRKMQRLNELRRGQIGWDAASADPLWACTGCRHCTVYCVHGNEPATVLFAGRAEATARGAGHPSLAEYPDRFAAREERLARQLRDQLAAEPASAAADVAFWPGCDAVDKHVDDVAAALALFARLGAGPIRLVAGAQTCGGYPLLAAGHPDLFRRHAGKVAAELAPYRKVVLNCSACVFAMRALYPAEGVALAAEVLHISEYLAEASDRIPRPETPRPVYYHDPCYLSRHVGIADAPRRVLARVAEVREFAWSRTDSDCCGGAGVLPKTMPAVADAMARRRLGEIARKGGGTVATGCATCAFMLKRNAPSSVEVHELTALVQALAPAG
jgi:Fe-S oxidoreductase